LRKNFGAKAAHKMLVKLTADVHFTKILQVAFSNGSVMSSLSVLTVCVCMYFANWNLAEKLHPL